MSVFAAAESASDTRPRRIPLLDPLRAAAALMVVAHHQEAFWHTHHSLLGQDPAAFEYAGAQGVAIFFLIAGWVIYRPFIIARRTGSRVDVPAYALRRIVRIVPAYWIALAAAAFILPASSLLRSGHVFEFAAFLQIYTGSHYLRGLTPAWTLDIEILWYVLAPAIVLIIVWRLRRFAEDAELMVIVLLAGLGMTVRLWAPYSLWVNGLPAYLAYFAVGMGLARASLSPRWTVGRPGRFLGSLPGMLVMWGLAVGTYFEVFLRIPPLHTPGKLLLTPYQTPGQFLAMGLVALLVVAPALGAEPSRSPVRRVATWLGERSYGIYLWHVPFIVLIGAHVHSLPLFLLLTLAAPIIVASISWRFVERPLNSWAAAVARRRAATDSQPTLLPTGVRASPPVAGV